MRPHLAILPVLLCLGTAAMAEPGGTAVMAEPAELVTAPDAILCWSAENLDAATKPAVAKSQIVLQAMGCLRSEAGVRTQVVRNAPDGAWQVRFYPEGISGGVVLWGRPSSFTAPDGSRTGPARRT